MKRLFKLLIILVLSLSLTLTTLTSCERMRDEEEYHIKEIRKRFDRRFFSKYGEEYTSFEVYPIYLRDERLGYFLIEMEPYGFLYIILWPETYVTLLGQRSRYGMSNRYGKPETWRKFVFREGMNLEGETISISPEDYIYETDENGNHIHYNVSHFKLANVLDERKYIINGTPAVKRGDKYLNLITLEEFTGEKRVECGGDALRFHYEKFYNLK